MRFLDYSFMQRALVAAALVGLTAPTVGIYLVQRRLSLIGDGLGHVALAGVAIGLLTNTEPVLTALAAATMGAVAIELIRARGRTSGDVALALLFYGGIAGGVVVVSQSPGGTPARLQSYLFGSLTTTTAADLWAFGGLTVVVLAITVGLRRLLFAVSDDEEFARASGMPVTAVNLCLAVVAALVVVVSMRVVGLLLVSALMIVPVATAQVLARSFGSTLGLAAVVGVTAATCGVVVSFHADTPPGGTIVLVALGAFAVASGAAAVRRSGAG